MQYGADVNGLDNLFSQIDNLALSREDKAEVCAAGAEQYAKHLKNAVRELAYDENKVKGKHLADMITYQKNEYTDGSTDVGFIEDDAYYYTFVNEGHNTVKGIKYATKSEGKKRTTIYRRNTKAANYGGKHIPGKHFMERAADTAENDINRAMMEKLNQIKK